MYSRTFWCKLAGDGRGAVQSGEAKTQALHGAVSNFSLSNFALTGTAKPLAPPDAGGVSFNDLDLRAAPLPADSSTQFYLDMGRRRREHKAGYAECPMRDAPLLRASEGVVCCACHCGCGTQGDMCLRERARPGRHAAVSLPLVLQVLQ